MLQIRLFTCKKMGMPKLVLFLTAAVSLLVSACGSNSAQEEAFAIARDTYGYENPVEISRSVAAASTDCSDDNDLVLFVQDEDSNAHTLSVCFVGNTPTDHVELAG